MKLTGERVMNELGFAPSAKFLGTSDAAQGRAERRQQRLRHLSDADVAASCDP